MYYSIDYFKGNFKNKKELLLKLNEIELFKKIEDDINNLIISDILDYLINFNRREKNSFEKIHNILKSDICKSNDFEIFTAIYENYDEIVIYNYVNNVNFFLRKNKLNNILDLLLEFEHENKVPDRINFIFDYRKKRRKK